METEVITQISPDLLLANANSRFGLRKPRIEQLMQSILEKGEIVVPLDVELLDEPENGYMYRIVDGHYRHAAATRLNKEQSAGLSLPIRVHPESDRVSRLKRQVTLNLDREDPSPMDMAVAIKDLLDEGVPRQEIKALFRRSGGRKGDKVQDASNAYLNMMVSFLDFPKKIQNLIHERVLGTAAAYALSRKPKDKWDEITAQAVADREAEAEAEDKMEERLQAQEKKEADAKEKREQLEKDRAEAETALKAAAAEFDKANEAEVAAFNATKKVKDDAEKRAAADAFKAAQDATKAAQKATEEAKKTAERLKEKIDRAEEAAKERAKKLADARKADKAAPKKSDDGKKPIGPKAIDKAAGNVVKLTAVQMREAVKEWALPGSLPKVAAIAAIIMQCFDSELTPSQAYTAMGKVTGESTKRK